MQRFIKILNDTPIAEIIIIGIVGLLGFHIVDAITHPILESTPFVVPYFFNAMDLALRALVAVVTIKHITKKAKANVEK